MLHDLVEAHAPMKKCKVKIKEGALWYNSDIHHAKQLRRRYERHWRHTKSDTDLNVFKKQRSLVNNLIRKAKISYYQNKFENVKDQKELFQLVNNLLDKKGDKTLPETGSDEELASQFSKYFEAKITSIRKSLLANSVPQTTKADTWQAVDLDQSGFSNLSCITAADVEAVIKSMPTKSCSLDFVPTWLLKECISEIAPYIAHVVNLSFSTGIFPSCLKQAIVYPLLKKVNLDHNNLNNYRPVSNLPFLSKVIERIVSNKLVKYLSKRGDTLKFQSAYTKYCSTETAVARITNDLGTGVDQTGAAAVVLLDLSAAFDTIDHGYLLSRLNIHFGVGGKALEWLGLIYQIDTSLL